MLMLLPLTLANVPVERKLKARNHATTQYRTVSVSTMGLRLPYVGTGKIRVKAVSNYQPTFACIRRQKKYWCPRNEKKSVHVQTLFRFA